VNVTYASSLWASQTLDLVHEAVANMGSVHNDLATSMTIRWGNPAPLHRSVHYNGLLGRPKIKSQKSIEAYIFYTFGVLGKVYDATIEGNFIGPESPFTMTPERIILKQSGGLFVAWNGFDIKVIYYRNSRETALALPHKYVGIHLNFRF
jgi:hypothetical protein